jgi:hypothetical protein
MESPLIGRRACARPYGKSETRGIVVAVGFYGRPADQSPRAPVLAEWSLLLLTEAETLVSVGIEGVTFEEG